MKTSLSVLALILTSIGAEAAEIYSQPPAAGNTGYLSSTDVNGGSNLESFVWESFTPPTTQTLREIQWRGTRTIAVPVDFKISLSTSLTSPGTVWHTNNAASETPTATPGVYDYKFTLPAGLVLTGGQGYNLQIIGLVNNYSPYTGAYWAWSAGTDGNNIHLAQVPAVTGDFRIASAAGDTAFTLLNAATVPVAIAVQALPAAGGTVTGGGTFNPGDSVTVTATPAVNRAFINWTEDGVVVSASASYTFAADGSKTLSANFTGPNTGPYVVTAAAVPNGTGNVGGAGTFTAGETVSLDASPQDPYPFVSWTENGNVVSTSLVYNFTATADRNLQANFTISGGSIAVVGTPLPANGGTVAVVGTPGLYANTFIGGSSVTLTATPAPGYHFVNWKQNADAGGPLRVVGTASPTFTYLVAYSSFLTANFEPNTPILTLGVTPAASGTVTGAGAYANGSTVTANATPAVGYAFASWKSGATVVSTSPSYTMTLTNHTALIANFVATNRTITATAAPLAGGSVTGAGVVGNGASVTLTASPASGYVFSSWTLGGAPAGTENPAIFNANANYTFVANFISMPVVSIAPPVAGNFSFSWPDTATGWVLQESPDLSPSSWVTSALPITTSGGQNQVSVPNPISRRFFRLFRP